MGDRLSIIIPTLNEATTIGETLAHLRLVAPEAELIVADGGSRDGTAEAAGRLARVVGGPPGRGAQLNAGAAAAHGEILAFLHADTWLPEGAPAAIAAALEDPAVVGGNFTLRFDGTGRAAGLFTFFYRQQRRLGIFYGDSAPFVRRTAFDRLGGFRALPIMDDYDFVRRLHRLGRVVCLPQVAITSARRWERDGLGRTLTRWIVIQSLFSAGVPAAWLIRLYPPVR